MVTPLALFAGSLRIEPHCSCIRTNRAVVLKSTVAEFGRLHVFRLKELPGFRDLRLQKQQIFSDTDMLDIIFE